LVDITNNFDSSVHTKTIRIDLVNNPSDVISGLLSNQGVKIVDLYSVIIQGLRYDDLHRALEEFKAFILTPLINHCSLVHNNGVYERVYISGDAMKIFILFHGFGNVGNFAILKGVLRGFTKGCFKCGCSRDKPSSRSKHMLDATI
jgi:hypothetical protein